MPRKREPARLYLEKERIRDGRTVQKSVYVIRDFDDRKSKPVKISTGFGEDFYSEAEKVFENYLAEKRAGERMPKDRDPQQVYVADIINYYLDVRAINWRKTDRYPKPIADPDELARRCDRLLDFWGDKTVEEIDHDSIDDYVDECESVTSARRQLEDLRAACNLAFDRKKLTRQIRFELPAKSDARSEYLDRSEVAKLLWTAWRKKGLKFADGTRNPDAYIWRHLVPFILTACYTGTRKTRIYNAAFQRMAGRPFVDLKKGIYHRLATNEIPYSNKQAPTIMLPGRLLAHMRRWQRMGRKFLVEYQGRAANPTKALRALIKEALGRDDIVIHSFRHTAATWLMEDTSLPLKDISEYLGMSMEMLQRYGQSRLGHQSAIGRSLSSSNGRAATVAR